MLASSGCRREPIDRELGGGLVPVPPRFLMGQEWRCRVRENDEASGGGGAVVSPDCSKEGAGWIGVRLLFSQFFRSFSVHVAKFSIKG